MITAAMDVANVDAMARAMRVVRTNVGCLGACAPNSRSSKTPEGQSSVGSVSSRLEEIFHKRHDSPCFANTMHEFVKRGVRPEDRLREIPKTAWESLYF